MKSTFALLLCFFVAWQLQAQERYFKIHSKDSLYGKPVFTSSLGALIKLNGYYDFFGGLQDRETFNVGAINVFGEDDDPSLNMDMQQSQIIWETDFTMKNGERIKAVIETDFWGGGGRIRLRKAYLETTHWQIGQNWNNFGDEDLWPNILEWEGPPSGVWLRTPHIKYMNHFANPSWGYQISLEAPVTDFDHYGDLEPVVEETHQNTPDFTAAISYSKDWGHLRLAGLLRKLNYVLDGDKGSFLGYGITFSGRYRLLVRDNFQFQLIAGKGITAYMTTITGNGYDGFPSNDGGFTATPAFGGWTSYEHYFTEKLHANAVLGFTAFLLHDSSRFLIDPEDGQQLLFDGDIDHHYYYGILNTFYDLFPRMTIGVELDYGYKKLSSQGEFNNLNAEITQGRDAMRLSFGFIFKI